MSGICHLVGAGPGDPGLLTLKGRDCLERADVVIYDALCNTELLRWVPESAERIFAGKRARGHVLTQSEINALLVEKTRAGKNVVRLKGGDPVLFGRGGEEALVLAEAGCRFEIVPGVTSAIAGPAYAGIPVTHRDYGSTLTIFTGHEDPEKDASAIDYAALARDPGTKILLMGVERLATIAGTLIAHGMPADLPVALVRWATTGGQQTLVGTVENIARLALEVGFESPAIAIFGRVVELRRKLNWFEELPLFGKRIAVTRARPQAGELAATLRALGADAYELPTIRIEPAPNKREFYELVADAHIYDWIVFPSPNAVDAFFRAFYEIFRDARDLGGARIAAIGPATADRIRSYRFQVDVQPEKFVAEAVVDALRAETSVDNLKFLLPRAEGGRDVIAEKLGALGAIVDEAIAYRTVPETDSAAAQRFREHGADFITFTSASTVANFLAMKLDLPKGLRTVSIGPLTSKAMRQRDLSVDVEAKTHDIPGLVAALVADVNPASAAGRDFSRR